MSNVAFPASPYIESVRIVLEALPPMPTTVEMDVVNLAHCPECRDNLVHPVSCQRVSGGYYLKLRCPNCEAIMSGVWDDVTVGAYDHLLGHGTDLVMQTLDQLYHDSDLQRDDDPLD